MSGSRTASTNNKMNIDDDDDDDDDEEDDDDDFDEYIDWRAKKSFKKANKLI